MFYAIQAKAAPGCRRLSCYGPQWADCTDPDGNPATMAQACAQELIEAWRADERCDYGYEVSRYRIVPVH